MVGLVAGVCCLLSSLVGACAVNAASRGLPDVPGGSVSDPDRGGGDFVPGTSTPAGAVETLGNPDWRREDRALGPVVEELPAPAAPEAALLAGPPEAGRRITDPDIVRALQVALSTKGYFHGPPTGSPDSALTAALRRYQADQRLPVTGALDEESAKRLGVPMPNPIPPRQG